MLIVKYYFLDNSPFITRFFFVLLNVITIFPFLVNFINVWNRIIAFFRFL
jgi:hypothetical protein